MVIDYFNSCVHTRRLGIAAQIKIMEEPLFIFSGQWFSFIRLWKIQDCVIEEERF
jgi:hypothetical protein